MSQYWALIRSPENLIFFHWNPSGTFRNIPWHHQNNPKKVQGAPTQGTHPHGRGFAVRQRPKTLTMFFGPTAQTKIFNLVQSLAEEQSSLRLPACDASMSCWGVLYTRPDSRHHTALYLNLSSGLTSNYNYQWI